MNYFVRLRTLPDLGNLHVFLDDVKDPDKYRPIAVPAGLIVGVEPLEPWEGNHIHARVYLYTKIPGLGNSIPVIETVDEIEKQIQAKD